jgi:Asp-tRNA(Asn)/Glu-tRNA(Gln) amidotransferase A subunit family amidase
MGATNIPLPHLAGVVEGDTVVAPSRSSSTSPLQGVRLGVFWDHFHHTDEEVQRKCSEAVSFLEAKGAEVVNITIPHLREIHLSHGFKILSGTSVVVIDTGECNAWNPSGYSDPNECFALSFL